MMKLLLIGLTIFFSTGSVYAVAEKDKEFYNNLDPIILELIENVHHEHFDKAIALADKMIELAPHHPVGYFFKSAIYDTIIRDYGDHRHYVLFDTMVNKAIDLSVNLLDEEKKNGEPDDEWLHFYLGGSLGFRGLYRFNQNKLLSAFRDGIAAIKQLDISMQINPELYDSYYGLGCFYYWKSAKSRFLWFLPFVSDERAKGIEQLIMAVKKGRYTSNESRNALLRVYLNEQMYDKTIQLAEIIEEEHPEDVFCLIFRGIALQLDGKYREAADNYQRLIDKYLVSKLNCFERIADMCLRKVEALREINDTDEIDNTLIFVLAEKKRRAKADELISDLSKDYINKIKKIHRDTVR